MTTQVFGPQRPNAAYRAIARLDALEHEAQSWGIFVPKSLHQRLVAARQERAHYWEYANAEAARACL